MIKLWRLPISAKEEKLSINLKLATKIRETKKLQNFFFLILENNIKTKHNIICQKLCIIFSLLNALAFNNLKSIFTLFNNWSAFLILTAINFWKSGLLIDQYLFRKISIGKHHDNLAFSIHPASPFLNFISLFVKRGVAGLHSFHGFYELFFSLIRNNFYTDNYWYLVLCIDTAR